MDNPTVLESGEDGWPVLCDQKFEPINSLLVSGRYSGAINSALSIAEMLTAVRNTR
jgi:hypothetical protein